MPWETPAIAVSGEVPLSVLSIFPSLPHFPQHVTPAHFVLN
ncbi:hypothetical protein [Phormidium sp. CCY1219]|nr:hypothetical protein [Phormidium sp. CCY1219]